jgi:L-lysine cyclodeaminase
MQRADEFAERRDELTVFDSTGWAVEDDVALRLAVELATAHDVGHQIELERLPRDPYDPYGDV